MFIPKNPQYEFNYALSAILLPKPACLAFISGKMTAETE